MVASPHPTILHRLDQNARRLLPTLISFILGMAVVLPIGLPHWGELAPPLLLISIFYWATVRPDLMPPTAAFVLGLFQDLLTHSPLGMGALIMVLTQWIMRGQRRYLANRPFFLMWAAFAPVVARFLTWQPEVTPDTSAYCTAVRAHPLVARWYAEAAAEPDDWLVADYETLP